MLKRLAVLILCICLIFGGVFGINASAEVIRGGHIKIDTVSGVTGNSVLVAVRIKDNPGIMAITVSITYNSKALTYEKFYLGNVIEDYTVVAHPDKNIIRFVNCESSDINKDGVLLYLRFKIKEDAEAELHEIGLEYSEGDFCNWDLDKIMPEVTTGGVDVAFNGNNCSHKKYGEWTVAAEPSCEEKGAEQAVCQKCGNVKLRDTDPIGHEYSDQWTVDKEATKEAPGEMSRHCIRCSKTVDRITFNLEQSEEGKIENKPGTQIPVTDKFAEEIFKEQYPGEELTPNTSPEQSGDKVDNILGDALSNANPEAADKLMEALPNFTGMIKIGFIAVMLLITLVLI
ncbi:MAG: hypothetical protein IKD04_10360 [Clostridia bacterium]|nr:hypothetical protein [Clostridia bacterium]